MRPSTCCVPNSHQDGTSLVKQVEMLFDYPSSEAGGIAMWSVEYFSEGIGLLWLIIGGLTILAGLGVAVHFSRMRPYLGNIMVPSCLIVLSLVFWILTLDFPQDVAGAAVIPRLYIFLILVLSGLILMQIFRGREKSPPRLERKGFLFLTMVGLIVYFLVMPLLGYFLSTFLFLVVMMHMLAYKRRGFIWLIAGGWVIFSYFLFYKLLYIQLPLGVFENFF
ncbi:MAG: tripartite tricarboxylate transporter TctB family protein [Syntrophales bacterium]